MAYSKLLLLAILSFLCLAVNAQVGVDYTLTKPKKFENRVLASEKSNDGKKFRKSRRFIQNTITHYNYWFNANEKMKMVVARAKSQFREDYTKLLPFYNFTLEATLAQKKELDSIIYKCTAGILIHDTRNDWIDNLYLLIGETYYYKKQFDSAYITFQFLNFAFAPKESDGYDIPIGSNANQENGGNANIVSTNESKRHLIQRALSQPPSRNEGLIWKIRNYIAQEKYAEAGALIEVLKMDPTFPTRLRPSLHEVQALWFYRQNTWDSAAIYLEKALPAAFNQQEAARWEYLIAQLYEKTNNSFQAKTFYERTIAHTYDPILEIYARLNAIRQNKDGGADFINKNIEALVKMAHRDKYESYRDIIYYTAGQMELERQDSTAAIGFLRQSIRYTTPANSLQRNRSFLLLANLCVAKRDYRPAKNYYDSLNISPADAGFMGDLSYLNERKTAVNTIVAQLKVIDRQDSLQRIAGMPVPQRDAYIKKLVRTLRRQQGLRDETDSSFSGNNLSNNNAIPDLFAVSSGSTDWYFNNPNLKSKGYSDFKNKWGNRTNTDNWQVSSLARSAQLAARSANQGSTDAGGQPANPNAIDFKTLLNNLPLTPAKLKKSNDSVERALFILGKTFQENIPDYLSAITSYDSLLNRFPATTRREESLFNEYYCYLKLGDQANADRILQLLKQKYPNGRFASKAISPEQAKAPDRIKIEATHQYEKIYLAFIEGRFNEALQMKKTADSLYGDKYWTPQLLYIESVYFIKTNQDPQAKVVLNSIIMKFPRTPMTDKAATLLDVLNRRRQIEDYLTNLQVTRAKDDDILIDTSSSKSIAKDDRPRLVRNDSNLLKKEDTAVAKAAHIRQPAVTPGATLQKPTIGQPGIGQPKMDTSSMAKMSQDAIKLAQLKKTQDSINAAMAVAARADSLQAARLRARADSINAAVNKLKADTAALAAKLRTLNSVFSLTPDKAHDVIIVLDKVDPVYVGEAKNAFNRFNTETYFSQPLTTDNASLSDSLKMVVISGFNSDAEAADYLQKTKPLAAREIIPWLPANKYTFLIISATNLELLLNNKDMSAYRRFLSAAYPGKY